MNTGLFFGSFNPIHNGHLIIAEHLLEYAKIDKIWMMVSPQNPLKNKSLLINEQHRYQMVKLAVENNPRIKPSSFEFNLPRPSYTIDTLNALTKQYPSHKFSIIMGGDSLASINKWKNFDEILNSFEVLVYRREKTFDTEIINKYPNINLFNSPLIEISSTEIRNRLKQGISIRYLVPDAVRKYIEVNNLFRD